MKTFLLVCLAALFFIGCDRGPVEEVADEMLASCEISRTAADEASLRAIQQYIQSYRAMNDRYPESIEELESALGTGYDLEPYDYDPGSGTLTLR
jgi:hypothetical protein